MVSGACNCVSAITDESLVRQFCQKGSNVATQRLPFHIELFQQRLDDLGLRLDLQARAPRRPGGVAAQEMLFRRRNVAFLAVGQFDVHRRPQRALRLDLQARQAEYLAGDRRDAKLPDANRLKHQFAARLADWLIANRQADDGSYRARSKTGVHYTSVHYMAKNVLELAVQEKKLAAGSELWRERYQRHFESARRDLLRLRREHPVFCRPRHGKVDGAVLGPQAFVLRFFAEENDDRLLLVNFGLDLQLDPAPEPLLAPPAGKLWKVLWSSEDPAYGGSGTPPPETENNWRIQGQAAIVMIPEKTSAESAKTFGPR